MTPQCRPQQRCCTGAEKMVSINFWHYVVRDLFGAVDTSNALFRILIGWVTILVWPFSVSRHHLLYSSIPQEVPRHCPLGMVQHFMIHATKQQFFCFISSKWGDQKILSFLVFVGWRYQHWIQCASVCCQKSIGQMAFSQHAMVMLVGQNIRTRYVTPGYTTGGSITVPLTSCLTGFD